MGGNCVMGYIQNFDLEGEHGIVVRGIGTVALIYKSNANASFHSPSAPGSASFFTNNMSNKTFNFNTTGNSPSLVVPSSNNGVKE